MSLWFSHGDAQWSYAGFNDFRVAIAAHEGVDLEAVYDSQNWQDVTTPLLPLLHHADTHGDLPPGDCRQVAARLREILPAVFADDPDYLTRGLELARGMELACQAGVPLQFM